MIILRRQKLYSVAKAAVKAAKRTAKKGGVSGGKVLAGVGGTAVLGSAGMDYVTISNNIG